MQSGGIADPCDPVEIVRSHDRHDPRRMSQQPCHRKRRHIGIMPRRDAGERVVKGAVAGREQRPACQRRPGHRRDPVLLKIGDIAICEGRVFQHADFDLVGREARVHRRLQKVHVPRAEVRDTDLAHLAGCHQPVQRRAGLVMVHQRVLPVHQQHVDALDLHQPQAVLDGLCDVRRTGVVIFHPCRRVASDRCHDVAFGDDLDLVLQMRRRPEGVAENFLGLVTAIDVGLVHRGDALLEA